jgi:hypothetical protein
MSPNIIIRFALPGAYRTLVLYRRQNEKATKNVAEAPAPVATLFLHGGTYFFILSTVSTPTFFSIAF